MRYKLDFILKNDIECFRAYVCSYSKTIYRKINDEKSNCSSSYLTLEEYITYQKLAVLDKQFWDFLNDEEIRLCQTTIKKHYSEQTKLERKQLERIYDKWQMVFFSRPYKHLFNELNPISLGIVLSSIRIREDVSQTKLANMMGVNRKTIILIEGGKRYPSLIYLVKFGKLFQISIDKIISFSLIE